jgi:phosphatidate cytidylyltransferase
MRPNDGCPAETNHGSLAGEIFRNLMSPYRALHDPIFLAYVWIIFVSLLVGGLALGILHWGFRKDLGSIWSTYRSWLIMAPVGMAAVFLGRVPTIIGATLLAVFVFKEFARASGLYRDWWMTGAVYAGIVAVGIASFVPHPRGQEPGSGWYGFFVAVPVFAIGLILLIPILRNRARGELQKMSLSIVGFIYIGWMFGHLGFLANAVNAYGFLCYVIFATELNDVSAFTFGRLFGRHRLRSEISPNKTWEGALGAVAVSMILPWLLRLSFPFFGTTQLILTGLIVGIGGLLGDLSISVIKRDIGAKDMGAAIPGHGGILDRIDSLVYVAPLFMHMAGYYYGLR